MEIIDDFIFDPNSDNKYGRWRLYDPCECVKIYFYEEKENIIFIKGILINGKKIFQEIKFKKNHWNEEKAKIWWNKNKHLYVKKWKYKNWKDWLEWKKLF